MRSSRRGFLGVSGALAANALARNLVGSDAGRPAQPVVVEGYGPLILDRQRVCDLPRGFSYHIFSQTGETMDDGLLVPTQHDGMAAFPGRNGKTILVRNHEMTESTPRELGPFGENNRLLNKVNASLVYDFGHGDPPLAATVNLVYDTKARRLEKQFLSLAGILRVSSGGTTPWRTWVCSEETSKRAGSAFAKDHGFNFEVPATEVPSRGGTTPLKAMGRFTHEGVALHQASGVFYETEDRDDALF